MFFPLPLWERHITCVSGMIRYYTQPMKERVESIETDSTILIGRFVLYEKNDYYEAEL